MQNKYKAVVILTVIVAVSIGSIVGVSALDRNKIPQSINTTAVDEILGNENNAEDLPPEETTITDNKGYVGNQYLDILNQILGNNKKYETVLGAGNIGGENPHETDVVQEIGGETVTVLFETETTSIDSETTILPETTITITHPNTQPPAQESVTTSAIVTTITEIATTAPTEPIVTTIAETTTAPEEETTVNAETDHVSEPIDNSQGEEPS